MDMDERASPLQAWFDKPIAAAIAVPTKQTDIPSYHSFNFHTNLSFFTNSPSLTSKAHGHSRDGGKGSTVVKRVSFQLEGASNRPVGLSERQKGKRRQTGVKACSECHAIEPSKHVVDDNKIIAT